MAFSAFLADRIKQILDGRHILYFEADMMGRHQFNINGKFSIGVWLDNLEVRVDPEIMATELKNRKFSHLDESGRRMRGFIIVEPSQFDTWEELEYWIDLALKYNTERFAATF